MTGVDFSHFNLAMRCLASGGGGGGGCWGCIERPSYIHLSPPTHSPPSLSRRSSLARPLHPLSLFSLRHSWPSTPSAPFPTFSVSSTFSSSTSFYGIATLPPPPAARATSRPSFATHLNPPLSSASSRRHPFLNPDTLPPSFSAATVSRRLTSAPSFSRPLPRNAPADKQTADTSQFYAIVSFFICLLVSTLIQILLHTRGDEDPLARKYSLAR